MKIVVFGATGNIGSKLAHHLLDAGKTVVAVGRSADKLQDLASKGAHLAIGDLEDAAFVAGVLADADRAFVMIPPNAIAPDNLAYQAVVGDNIIAGLKASALTQVVNLSSIAAEKLNSKTGPIRGTGAQEVKLQTLTNKHIVTLRGAYFFENTLSNVGTIQGQQSVFSPNQPDQAFPAVATHDIAAKAFEILNAESWTSEAYTVHEVFGDKNYTMKEMATAMGNFFGVDNVNYVQIPVEAFKSALLGFGISDSMASLYAEMAEGMNKDDVFGDYERTPENTTPTSYEAWLKATFSK
jgi:uncharacterized protein YbjT (DUF2867 family)